MKPKTRKRLKKIATGFCVAIIVLVVLLYFLIGSIVKAWVEDFVPRVTGTPVKMESFSFSIFTGKARIRNFVIGNPEGFQTEHAFKLGELSVDVDMDTIFSDKLVIDEIRVKGTDVICEFGITTSNIKEIMKNVKKFKKSGKAGNKEDDTPAKDGAPASKGRMVQINHFYFNDSAVSVSAILLQGLKSSIKIEDVYLQDIGKDGEGVTPGEAALIISTAITKALGNSVSSDNLIKTPWSR